NSGRREPVYRLVPGVLWRLRHLFNFTKEQGALKLPSLHYCLLIISFNNAIKAGSVFAAAARISSIFTGFIFPGVHRSVIAETAKQGIPMCLAAIFSGAVDMPTASAPISLRYLYSALVSRFGPGTAAYTP